MANDASIGRHTLQQVQRLERNLQRLSGEDFKMPDHNRYGKEFLLIDQLKAINIRLEDMLGEVVIEAVEEPERETVSQPTEHGTEAEATDIQPPDETDDTEDAPPASGDDLEEDTDTDVGGYSSMTNPELEALIDERGLDKGKARTKPQLIAVLEAAEKANANAEE